MRIGLRSRRWSWLEVAPGPDGWVAIADVKGEPVLLRLRDGYDPRDDNGREAVQLFVDYLNEAGT